MRKYLNLVVSTILVGALLLGCSKGANSKKSNDTIKLGVLAPLTGNNAEYGKGYQVASKMAADEINAAGGINGKKIELILKDSKADQKESADLARQFVDDESIMAIVGPFTSGEAMANAPIVDEAKMVQLSPTASNPDYAGMSPYTFGIMGRQDGEAPYSAKYLVNKYMGAKTVGVIYINSDWGQSCFSNFKSEAEKVGLEIVAEANYVQDEKDFSSLITKVRASNPDTVTIMDQGAVAQVINQIRGAGWDVPLNSIGPGTSNQLIEQTGENSEELLLTSPFFFDKENAVLTEWKDKFVKEAGFEPTVHPVCVYDSVYLIAEAIKQIPEGTEITRELIRENLEGMEYIGMSGPIKFNAAGDITRKYMIVGVENGEYIVKEDFDYGNK